MSKVTKRKITVESASNKLSNTNTISGITSNKDSQRRQSVFERLGTKTGASISLNTGIGGPQPSSSESFCRHWSQNGTCPYGKSCVFVNTHILISPSKRIPKKELDPKQVLARSLEEGLKLEGLKRLNSSVVKRGSPDLNWESWDQTDLEYEDEKVLEKRRQLLQRELELQMKREETEEHHSKRRHSNTKQKKGLSSSSSTSVSSTSSESSSSSDDSSSDSSSTSGIAADSKRRRSKTKKSKRGSTSSVSDSERKKVRDSSKPMHKDRSPSNISRKSTSSRDKRAFTPPKKSAPNAKMVARKKSPSPAHRRHNTPTASSKTKPAASKSTQGGSRHNQSPRPSKRSTSIERKDKHKRSLSPRPRSKAGVKERSPRRQDPRPRRKDSPDSRPRNTSRSRLPDTRGDDRKKDDDRSRNKDDRRQERKPASDRDKRDHDDARAREKAREAAREKEREEALERCRERQREREQLAKEKERNRDRSRDDRDKDISKQRDYDKSIPQMMTVSIHNQADRKLPERDRDRSNKDRKDRDKDRDKDKDRERDRLYDRNLDKIDRNRLLEKDRLSEKLPDRDRGNDKDRPREREHLNDRNREKGDRDRSFERDRNFIRNTGEAADRTFERDKERTSKALERNRDREFDRDKDRNFERITDNRRSFEKAGERDRTSLEKDRGIVRDRALDRVLELRERNKSLERGRASDGERSVDRNRERYDREGRFDRRTLAGDEKGYESPYDTRRDRSRYGTEGSERVGMFKDLSPSRDDARGLRHSQGFNEDRRSRGGRDVRAGWEQRGSYDDSGSTKARDWDYPDSRREWDARNRHGEWEGTVEGEEWGRYSGGGEWGGGDWRDDWQHRPPRHPPREDQTIVSSNHIVVRDANNEDSGGRRTQVLDSVEKDPVSSGDFKKDSVDSGKAPVDAGSHKRQREDSEIPIEAKKPRLEDPLPSAMLEQALSDISDDPDEILNREDIDITPQDSAVMEEDIRSVTVQPSAHELDQRLLEERANDEENIDNLDFEEISDEELEEEARANKGLGDALGVDWASLVAESRPRPAETAPGAARRRWQPENILARIGVSMQYAGSQLYSQIHQQLTDKKGDEDDKEKQGLLHPVATLHVALRDRQARRRCLFSGTDTFKRALSARADIAIRRQLCNLPVASLEMQQSSGFCQWVV